MSVVVGALHVFEQHPLLADDPEDAGILFFQEDRAVGQEFLQAFAERHDFLVSHEVFPQRRERVRGQIVTLHPRIPAFQFDLVLGHRVFVGVARVFADVLLRGVVEDREGCVVEDVHVVLRRQGAVNDPNDLVRGRSKLQHGLEVSEAQKEIARFEVGTAEQGGFHVVEVHGVLGVSGAQNQVLKSVFSEDGRARLGVEDVARFGVDLGDAVVEEIDGIPVHLVPSTVPDVAPATLPLLHARPHHALRIRIDRVVKAQAVLPPQEVGAGIKPKQGAAVGDERNDR